MHSHSMLDLILISMLMIIFGDIHRSLEQAANIYRVSIAILHITDDAKKFVCRI